MKFFAALLASAAVASAKVVTYSDGIQRVAKTPEVLAAEVAHFTAKGLNPLYTGTGIYVAYSIPGFPYGLPGHPGLVEPLLPRVLIHSTQELEFTLLTPSQ